MNTNLSIILCKSIIMFKKLNFLCGGGSWLKFNIKNSSPERQMNTLPAIIKTALVVGGTQGIGAATAVKLIKLGTTNLVITGRNLERGKEMVEKLTRPNVSVTFESFDVTDLDQINDFTTRYKKSLNGSTIDIIVFCAV